MIVEDRNTNTTGAQLTGITTKRVGSKLSSIAKSISDGRVKTLIVFGEDVTKYGIDSKLLKKVTLIVSDILPNETTKLADYLLPGAHAEKRGTFTNVKGRVQKFMKALNAWRRTAGMGGAARACSQRDWAGRTKSIEGLFNQMAGEVKSFKEAELTWLARRSRCRRKVVMPEFITELLTNHPWLIVAIKVLGVFAGDAYGGLFGCGAAYFCVYSGSSRAEPGRNPITNIKLLGLGNLWLMV